MKLKMEIKEKEEEVGNAKKKKKKGNNHLFFLIFSISSLYPFFFFDLILLGLILCKEVFNWNRKIKFKVGGQNVKYGKNSWHFRVIR